VWYDTLMPIKPLVLYPSKILRTRCEELKGHEFFTDAEQLLFQDLRDTLKYAHPTGVALAAPQIGVNLRAFAIKPELLPVGIPDVFFNPVIVADPDSKKVQMSEGCLSVPGFSAPMARHPEVTVNAVSFEGELFHVRLEGLAAQAVQHEVDHLDGKLVVDSLPESARIRLATNIKRLYGR
jgi:peptide deformylase